MLSKTEILEFKTTEVKEIEIPEWGGSVYLRLITQRERRELMEGTDKHGAASLPERFAAMVLSDENGVRMFKDSDMGHLAQKQPAALDRILEVGFRFNKLTDDAVEESVKN